MYIPKGLYNYLDKFLKNEIKNSSFHQAVINHPKKTFESINRLFEEASEITGLECEKLLSNLDFKFRDLDPTRIESILGELRTIIFLNQQGFQEIMPLRASTTSASCDFSAKIDSRQCFLEVKTSIRFAPRTFHDSIVKWAMSKLKPDGALKQLNINSPDCINLIG